MKLKKYSQIKPNRDKKVNRLSPVPRATALTFQYADLRKINLQRSLTETQRHKEHKEKAINTIIDLPEINKYKTWLHSQFWRRANERRDSQNY